MITPPDSSNRPRLAGRAARTFPRVALALAALCLAQAVDAHEEVWTKQAPIPTESSVSGLSALSATELWCVAQVGPAGSVGLAHTKDAGLNWETIELDTDSLSAVFFLDPLHGWAAGNGFFHTTDGGKTWTKDNAWGSISDLFFLDTNRGWACGNGSVTYRTTNGGLDWTAVSAPGGTTMSSIWFVDAMNGWVVNIGGQIFRTVDGGTSWTLAADTGAYLASIQFFDLLEGWAIGGNTFLHTVDGGQSWSPATVPAGTWVYGARFGDNQRGVAVGQSGLAVRTTDGGQTWTGFPLSPGAGLLGDIAFAAPTTFFASGHAGTIARSTDSGLTWSSLQSGGSGTVTALEAIDDDRAWAASLDGRALVTSDGGGFWSSTGIGPLTFGSDLDDIELVDDKTGWVLAYEGTTGKVFKTTDGGLGWQLQLAQPGAFRGIHAIDTQTAFVVGGVVGASVLRTTDGGQSWTNVSPPGTGNYRDVHFADASTGWVAGTDLRRTTNGGQSWTPQYSGSVVSAVSFADAKNGWAVGYQNLLLHTDDGGISWTAQDAGAPPGTALLDVDAVSVSTAWTVGWGGFAARTLDAGRNWSVETLPGAGTTSLEAVDFLDADRGWIGGHPGIWRRGADPPALAAQPAQIPLSIGGSQTLALDAGPDHDSDLYLVLSSAGGTTPALPIDDVLLPLDSSDLWFAHTLVHPNTPPFADTLGVLDAAGVATATLDVPSGAPSALLSVTLHHAFLVFDLAELYVSFASNPVSLTFGP